MDRVVSRVMHRFHPGSSKLHERPTFLYRVTIFGGSSRNLEFKFSQSVKLLSGLFTPKKFHPTSSIDKRFFQETEDDLQTRMGYTPGAPKIMELTRPKKWDVSQVRHLSVGCLFPLPYSFPCSSGKSNGTMTREFGSSGLHCGSTGVGRWRKNRPKMVFLKCSTPTSLRFLVSDWVSAWVYGPSGMLGD